MIVTKKETEDVRQPGMIDLRPTHRSILMDSNVVTSVWRFVGVAVVVLVMSVNVRAGGGHVHEGDVVVGRSSAGQVAVEFDFSEPIPLQQANGLLTGWLANEPGFMALAVDEPAEDFFTLGSDAQIVFDLVAIDPALKVWTPGFVDVLDQPGDQFVVGMGDFDTHMTFHIDSTDPAFDPSITNYTMSFQLLDAGVSGLDPSEKFTATFVAVPEPTSLVLLGCGMLVLRRRQTRHHSPRRP